MILITSWEDVLYVLASGLVYGVLFLLLLFFACAIVSSTIDSTVKTFYNARREASAVSYAMMQQLAAKEKAGGQEHA